MKHLGSFFINIPPSQNISVILKIIPLMIFLLAFLPGCDDNPVTPPQKNSGFAIYFLKDSTLDIRDVFDTDLKNLELADKPWLSEDDVEFYDWSSHCIYLKKDKTYFFPGYYGGLFYQLPVSWTDRPWIFVANNIPCYKGYFVTDVSTNIYPFPDMSALHVGLLPKDIISSDWMFWFSGSDLRENETVKEALIQSGLYHGGIHVTIDTTGSPIKVFNDDTTTVEYSLMFKNEDKNDLYIFDPANVEDEIFNFYNNGPNFWDLNTGMSYGSQYSKSRKPDKWDSDWYSILKSGEIVKRTIRRKGYPFIPPSTFLIQTRYNTPREGMERNVRETQKGRYYLSGGQKQTDTLRIIIAN